MVLLTVTVELFRSSAVVSHKDPLALSTRRALALGRSHQARRDARLSTSLGAFAYATGTQTFENYSGILMNFVECRRLITSYHVSSLSSEGQNDDVNKAISWVSRQPDLHFNLGPLFPCPMTEVCS